MRTLSVAAFLMVSLVASSAFAQRHNVGDVLRKTSKHNLKKKPRVLPVWHKNGTCHERNSRHSSTEVYKARCLSGAPATRYHRTTFTCSGRNGRLIDMRFMNIPFQVYEASRFTCTQASPRARRYQLGYDPGQSRKLRAPKAADYVCGCFTPQGGQDCDNQLCRGRMQAARLDPLAPVYASLHASGYLLGHVTRIDWARTLGWRT